MRNNLTACYFILTENCNLRCTYCFEKDTRAVHQYMSKETAFKMIDFLYNNALEAKARNEKEDVKITFFGGEPMLCVDLMTDMLHYGIKKQNETGIKVQFSIITNGTIYNDKVEQFLETWNELTKGQVDIQLSIDGTPEIQNMNRPCANKCLNSADLAEEAIEKFKAFYIKHNISLRKLHIHAVISKASLPKIYECHQYFRYKLKVDYKFAWVIEDDWDENDLIILDQQLDKICQSMLKNGVRDKNSFPFKRFDKCSGCSSGRRLVSMDTEGNIYPCHRFFFYDEVNRSTMCFGNIYNDSPIDASIRAQFLTIDESKMCNNPCQVCVAVNYEFCGNMYKRPNDFDEKSMVIINKHYFNFINLLEKKNTSKVLEELIKKVDFLGNKVMQLEMQVANLNK